MTRESKHMRADFLNQIKSIIAEAQGNALRAVDFQRVLMYWNIGKTILEEEQQGKERAEYGTSFSVRQLERCRQFYKEFPIASALRTQFSWTHYKLLLPLENNGKRRNGVRLDLPRFSGHSKG